jgi:D-glycero-D-manno-heptose 1,7-bisphosphate phosphatase
VSDTTPSGRPAVFIDRDGTLIDDLHYLSDPERVRLRPGAVEALTSLRAAGFLLIVATNQSGVARGLFSLDRMEAVHRRLVEILAADEVRIEGIYACPHHPSEGSPPYRQDCSCRKPRPGLFLAAKRDHDIDLARSFAIGDRGRDLAPLKGLGGRGYLINADAAPPEEDLRFADARGGSLTEAARWILGERDQAK